MSYEQDKRTLLAFMANPLPEPPMTDTRAIPMHPPMKHLTALSYFLIAGFQPRGRTELFQRPKGPSVMEQAAQVVMAALKRAQSPANAPCIETLSQ